MPRYPKTDGERRNRAKPVFDWTLLPAAGRGGPTPDVPYGSKLRAAGKRWWSWAWGLPVAAAWADDDAMVVLRRAQLEDEWSKSRDARFLAEMRQLEDRLGMTPKARLQLRWKIAGDVTVETDDNGTSPMSAAERYGSLRVVVDEPTG